MRILFKILFLMTLCTKLLSADTFHIITTEFSKKAGMFAIANIILGQLHRYECKEMSSSGFAVNFMQYGLYYDPAYGPNWWGYYFEPVSIGMSEESLIERFPRREYSLAVRKRRYMTREQAAAIIKKYIHVKAPIQEKVDQFTARHFQGFYVIGVHYRGTDKIHEAPRVYYEDVIAKIREHIPQDKPYQIFVATDEEPFLEMIRENFPNKIVATDAHRSRNEQNVHFNAKEPYKIGEEAIMDSLLLSKCDLLIRTSSSLSLWSTYFSPNLPTILINNKYTKTLEPE
jgi:nodulation protein Z